jgi:hypothetical protein
MGKTSTPVLVPCVVEAGLSDPSLPALTANHKTINIAE